MARLTRTLAMTRWLAVTAALLALAVWLALYGHEPVDIRRMR